MKIGVRKKAELKKNGVKGALFACSTGLLLVLSACAKEGASPAQAGASVAISQAGVSAAASSVDASKETQQAGASEGRHVCGSFPPKPAGGKRKERGDGTCDLSDGRRKTSNQRLCGREV